MARRPLLAAALLLGALALPAAAQDADGPLDRALQQVEALLSTLRATPGADAKLVARLEEIAGNLREAKSGGKDAGGGAPGATPTPGFDDTLFRITLDTFLQGVDLKEDGRSAAEGILREFVTDYALARKHEDEKSRAVIREHSEKRIGQTFASRDANRLKDNLDTIIKRWDWAGGRRGR